MENTTVILHGLNGMDDMPKVPDKSLSDSFRNEQLVAMAVRSPKEKKFVINKSLCSVENILDNYFTGEKKCEEFGETNLSKTTKTDIKKEAAKTKFTNNIAQKSLQEFNRWHKTWAKLNFTGVAAVPDISVSEDEKAQNAEVSPQEPSNNKLPPIEEIKIGENKIMDGQVHVAPESKTVPLSQIEPEKNEDRAAVSLLPNLGDEITK